MKAGSTAENSSSSSSSIYFSLRVACQKVNSISSSYCYYCYYYYYYY